MKNKALNELTLEDLRNKRDAEKGVYSQLCFAHAVSPIENPMRIRYTRRLVARISTLIQQKESAIDDKKELL